MPGRRMPIITGQIYHIFNRGINRQPTFVGKRNYERAVQTLEFYRFSKPPVSFSKFIRFDDEKQMELLRQLKEKEVLVKILAFCLMPNHFHFLLQQMENNGIAKFLSNFQNSYTRYFNTRADRDGALFSDQFKAVRIETDEQLMHVSRYIHLNPYTGYVTKTFAELEEYAWSSFPDYLKNNNQIITTDIVLNFFRNTDLYKRFVFDQGDYQRTLKEIEHLTFE